MGSAITNEKAQDAFQSQLSDLLGAQMTLTPKRSLWPQHISPDYSGKLRFSSLEICTQKRISQQERAINLSGGNGAPTNHPAGGQATATGLGPSREPPAPSGLSVWPSATRPGGDQSRAVVKGGQRSSFPSWAFPAWGRGETRRWRLSVQPRLRQPIRGLFPWPPHPAAFSQPVSPSPGRSSGSSSKMRPPTPPAPSALSPAATDTVAVPGLPEPEMQGDDPEPWTQSRFRPRLRLLPEPQPRPRRRRRLLPFRPPSSHGPAARRQPSHVIQPWPRPRSTTRGDALLGDAGAGRIPSLGFWVLLLSAAFPTAALATAWRQLAKHLLLSAFPDSLESRGHRAGHTCRHNLDRSGLTLKLRSEERENKDPPVGRK